MGHPDIPQPAHRTQRAQPLPWERTEPVEEEAQARLRAIMEHPSSYIEADREAVRRVAVSRHCQIGFEPGRMIGAARIPGLVVMAGGPGGRDAFAALLKTAKVHHPAQGDVITFVNRPCQPRPPTFQGEHLP